MLDRELSLSMAWDDGTYSETGTTGADDDGVVLVINDSVVTDVALTL